MRVSKNGCDLMQKLCCLFFQLLALDHCHARIFLIAGMKLLAWLVFRGLNNLCAALRFNL